MKNPEEDVTEAELAVMELLWSAPATIRGLRDRLYPRGGVSEYKTVQKLLERLEAKRYVRREAEATAHRFIAVVGREQLIGRRLRAVADELCGGSLATLFTGLASAKPLKPREIDGLRAMVEQLDKARRRK